MTTLLVLQWLHVVAGAVFVGGQVLFLAAVWPALLGLPAPVADRALAAIGPRVGPVLGSAALVAILVGIARATAWGPVRSGADLAGGYGLTAIVALGLTIAAMVHGATSGPRLAQVLFDRSGTEPVWQPGARAAVVRTGAISLALLAGILGTMVRLRFGA